MAARSKLACSEKIASLWNYSLFTLKAKLISARNIANNSTVRVELKAQNLVNSVLMLTLSKEDDNKIYIRF